MKNLKQPRDGKTAEEIAAIPEITRDGLNCYRNQDAAKPVSRPLSQAVVEAIRGCIIGL